MKNLSTDALYLISNYMHAGWPEDEVDVERFRRADCSDWSLWAGREDCIGSVRDAIKADERIRELIDWDDLKDSSCLTEDELIGEIAFQCWNWYWGCKVDSGEMDDIENDLKKEEKTMYIPVFTREGAQVAKIQPDGYSLYEYFTGYDFMGSADWTTDASEAKLMSLEEAEQIAQDLTDGESEEEEQTMKYIVSNDTSYATVLKTDSIVEALKARDAFDDKHPELDGSTEIYDAKNDRLVDADRNWDLFVMEIIECSDNPSELQPMDLNEAKSTLEDWRTNGADIPEGLTAEILEYLWNDWLQRYHDEYDECRQADDDASYQDAVQEAASFDAIDVDDLDDILREDDQPEESFEVDPDEYFTVVDPLIDIFQRALDAAVADRDERGKHWVDLTNKPDSTELECHRAYTRYEHAQGYLEGLTNGIFVAGYNIKTDVGTTKLTVTK